MQSFFPRLMKKFPAHQPKPRAIQFGALSEWQKANAVYCGTFDPPHNGHVDLVKAAIQELGLTRVKVIPTASPGHKPFTAPFIHRLRMTRLAFSDVPECRVSGLENLLPKPSSIYQTFRHLFGKPVERIPLILGGDALSNIPAWVGGKVLAEQVVFILFNRGENVAKTVEIEGQTFNLAIEPLQTPMPLRSSTLARAWLRQGRTSEGKELLPPKVLEYIKKHDLYA